MCAMTQMYGKQAFEWCNGTYVRAVNVYNERLWNARSYVKVGEEGYYDEEELEDRCFDTNQKRGLGGNVLSITEK